MGRHFPVREKSGNFVKFKNRWKILGRWENILEKSGNIVSPEGGNPERVDTLMQADRYRLFGYSARFPGRPLWGIQLSG